MDLHAILSFVTGIVCVTLVWSEECPAIPPDTAGICVEACSKDNECGTGHKCCSNGCGHVCKDVRCPSGVALRSETAPQEELFCGRGPTRVDCPTGSYCNIHPTDEYAVCCEYADPCLKNTEKCGAGEVCVSKEVQCIRAPCLPVPECVPIADVCKTKGPALWKDDRPVSCSLIQQPCPDMYECDTTPDSPATCCQCPIPGCLPGCDIGKDDNGCPTCECNTNTCKGADCADNEVCIDVTRWCDNPPCPSQAKCQDVTCHLKKDPGPCDYVVTRYYFDVSTRRCEEFIYGGCDGNANNFHSMRECVAKCSVSSAPGTVVSSHWILHLLITFSILKLLLY